jgi:hypothetical protein
MWTCDACGKEIETIKAGWIEWIDFERKGDGPYGEGLRLVHHLPASPRKDKRPTGCQYNERELPEGKGLSDLPLQELVGPDGLMYFLMMIHDREVPTREVLEMVKRLHIPGYEQARHWLKKAVNEGAYEPSRDVNFPLQSEINAVLEYSRKRRSED